MKTTISVLWAAIRNLVNLGILVLAVIVIYSTTTKAFEYGQELVSQSTSDKPFSEVELVVAEADTPMDIANTLEKKGLIPNALLFRLQTKLNGTEDLLLPGTYTLNTQMEGTEIIEILQTPAVVYAEDLSITISEGYTIRQMGDYLESREIVTAEEFLEACNTGTYSYSFLSDIPERENRLEGYLFPDTYFIEKGATATQIVDKLLGQFEKVYSAEYQQRAQELGLTMDQVVTMASIIEKEIQVDLERPKAASVIYNRLATNTKLQMCSTILYALGKRKDRLLDADLQVESPYNTYMNEGLPVGPIASPGKACIEAVLYPEETDYLYFVLKGDEATEHVFTNDYDEFLNAKEIYQQKF